MSVNMNWFDEATTALEVNRATREKWIREIIDRNDGGSYIASGDSLVVVWPSDDGSWHIHDCIVRRAGWAVVK